MRLDHPIFHHPLEPTIELTEIDTPGSYRNWPDGRHLGPKMKVWKVHDGKFPQIDVGLVCDPYGFEDTPDAEWISSGVNSKGPGSVALARVGNFFHWGFFGDPSLMTASARQVFVNTICWMKQFDGQRPLLSAKQAQARDWVLVYVGYVRELGESDSTFTSHSADGTKQQSAQEFLRTLFPAEILAAAGQGEGKLDAGKLEKYYLDHFEFLVKGDSGIVVDADVRELGVSNRRPEFLTVLAQRLEQDPSDALALRCIERYVRPPHSEPGAIARWLRENFRRMYFSDVAGYRWYLTPAELTPRESPFELPRDPTPAEPVVAAACAQPQCLAPGEAFTLTIHVRTAPTWHIYAHEAGTTSKARTELALELPPGIEAAGDWQYPPAHSDPVSGEAILEGRLEFHQQLRVVPSAQPGKHKISATLRYQCCDPFQCRPPEKLGVACEVEVVAR